MYKIIGKVKENSLPDHGTSEENLPSKFCNIFVDNITYIRNMFMDCSTFVLDRNKETGIKEFNQLSELYVGNIIGDSKATSCWTDSIPSQSIKCRHCTSLQSLPPL